MRAHPWAGRWSYAYWAVVLVIAGANMQRLNIAKVQLRSFMSDTIHLRAAQPNEVAACAKVREALALITEAELLMAPPAVFHRLTFDKWKRLV